MASNDKQVAKFGTSEGMFNPDSAFEEHSIEEIIEEVTNSARSVPLRGRAILEFGRRAENEADLQSQLAEWIIDHEFRKKRWVGTITLAWIAACSLGYSLRRSENRSLIESALSQWLPEERALLFKWAKQENWFAGMRA